jgi:glutaconate CoA-transferase subunit A
MNKSSTLTEAVASIDSGMTIGIGGWGSRRKPMALVRELLRSDVSDLTVVSYGGADVGMLCAAGKIRKLVFAFASLDFIPLEPYFRLARQQGSIEVMEIDEGMMMLGLEAAARRLPFIPTAVGLGTDVLTRNPQLKLVQSPYNDSRDWVAMPALELDIALIHVDKADERGVCQINAPDRYMDDLFARAAKHTVVSTEEIVDVASMHGDASAARAVFWERSETDRVVHAPCGAHPSSCQPVYGHDADHFKAYAASAREEDGWERYRATYLAGDEAAYLEAVGGAAAIRALPLPVY